MTVSVGKLICVFEWNKQVNVRRFEDVQVFYQNVEPFLMQDEVAHNVILGLRSQLMKSNVYNPPLYLGRCEHDGEIVGVTMRTPPFHLLLSRMTHEGAVEAFARDAYAFYGELSGALGLKEIAAHFAQHWEMISGQRSRMNRNERSYKLEKVVPVRGINGEYCPPTEEDFELMTQWAMDFSAEAMDGMPRDAAEKEARSRLESDPKVRGMRFWVVNGKPVSMAGYGNLTPNGVRIGPVYTPPEFRGRGYASALTAALSQELLDNGRKFVTLFTDLSNPTSNHIYQAIGYQPVYDVDEYHFEPAI